MRRQSSIRDELLRPPVEYDPPRRKDNLFLWTVFLLLLVGFSMVCWIGSYLVFSRPELPFSYRLLRKIKKIDEPQRFKVNAAPPGEFLGPERLYNRFNALNPRDFRELNRSLERAYLRNYPTSNELVPYATGRFTIMESYELHDTDFVANGVVTLAVSADFPKLLIEHIYSCSAQDAPLLHRNLQTGMDIELRRTFELSAVLHVTKLNDGRMQLTIIPINYGRYVFTNASGGFDLQPPPTLNVAAPFPLIRGDRLESANIAYVDFRTRSGLGPVPTRTTDTQRSARTALKGVEVPVEEPPLVAAAASPAPAVVPTGIPVNVPKEPDAASKSPSAASPAASPPVVVAVRTNVPVLPAIPVNEPAKRPNTLAVSPVKPSPAAPLFPSGAPRQPFLTDAPSATPKTTWTMYAPGHQPGGKNVRVSELATLGQRGPLNGEPLYLTGQFVVSAVGENRLKGVKNAVLHSGSDGTVRVIVEYPADRTLPAEGAEVSRDEQRPYQIMNVRRVENGTLYVYAREVTEP